MKVPEFIEPGSSITLSVALDQELIRTDRYLSQKLPGYSRNFFQQLIKEKRIKVDDAIINKPSFIIKPQQKIFIEFPIKNNNEGSDKQTDHLAIAIIYEHDDFLILNKPAHLLTHSPSINHDEVTLVDWLLNKFAQLKSVGYEDRPGIVHRLDKDTSGLMIVPRNNRAHAIFATMFQNRTIKKQYTAVVTGHPPKKGVIDFRIARHPTKPQMTHRAPHGRDAITHYEVIEYFKNHALVNFYPITGRTHQIRVHCAGIGHPLVGDAVYGSTSTGIARQALHATHLNFSFDGTEFSFEALLPQDMQKLITALY